MSHDLETHNGETAFFTSSRVGWWHQLGTLTTEAQTAEDALRIAHLDWTVEKDPIYAAIPTEDGVSNVRVEGKYATTRINPFTKEAEVLDIVGERYTVVQNYENADFLNALVGQSGAHFETAGSLNGGRQVFISMKAPTGLLIGGHDAVELYLVATNSHDGKSAFTVMATPIRPVCKNTLRAGLRSAKSTFKVRHTESIGSKIEEAQEALGMMWSYAEEFEAMANKLYDTSFTDRQFENLVKKVLLPEGPNEGKAVTTKREAKTEQLKHLWKSADTQEGIRGTKWGAYNAITEWLDWELPVRGDDRGLARAERIAGDFYLDAMKDKVLAALV